ncbi:MAG: tetratricopeptide repeat protein [Candidatus Thiodiazotropha sp. (ex Clathrolucina costata)]|nr:tetratricopeptide repeat protein [Candidatus Thiodiazotropha taylori]MCG7864293.1 tetratricopeptide repeat protein [Candidatus Thiodiazotropha endolucinida]
MSPPKVFISATSADLAPAREVVKKALLTISCHPVEQSNFPPDWRTVTQMLRNKIADCQAMIHIAGLHYGNEPDPESLTVGDTRRSYTQLEYDIGCELQHKRGDRRFRVYTFICPVDFPYRVIDKRETEEKQKLQEQHREHILAGKISYEQPHDLNALEARVLALHEDILSVLAIHDKHVRLMLSTLTVIAMILLGIGYSIYQTYHDIPIQTAVQIAQQLDTEIIAERLKKGIQSRFVQEAQAAHDAGKTWQEIRELERLRDSALGRVDDVVRTIKEGLAANPVPVFLEASSILVEEGEEAALAYLESHKTGQLAKVTSASVQAEIAQETIKRELLPLVLQADILESQLKWDQAISIRKTIAKRAPYWIEALDSLAGLFYILARYEEAEQYWRRALTLASTPQDKAMVFNNLAQLLQETNRFSEAEPMMRQALAIDEKSYGVNHPTVAVRLGNLARLLHDTNRLTEAEPLYRRALAIGEASDGPNHPNVGIRLNNLSQLLLDAGRFSEAEPAIRRSLAITEAFYGPTHPDVAIRLNNLVRLLQATNRLSEAEPLARRALEIDESSYGSEHPKVAIRLGSIAGILQETGRTTEAEPLLREALAINEIIYGSTHPNVAISLSNIAILMKETGRVQEAIELMRRALSIDENSYGLDHNKVAIRLNNLAQLLKSAKRLTEAEPLMRRALAINELNYGSDHPSVAISLNNLGLLLLDTNHPLEAESLLRRALTINETSFGADHPNVATVLSNLALLLQESKNYLEAKKLVRRALAINEMSYGRNHVNVANDLSILSDLFEATGEYNEAVTLRKRCVEIYLNYSYHNERRHPYLDAAIFNYNRLLDIIRSNDVSQE